MKTHKIKLVILSFIGTTILVISFLMPEGSISAISPTTEPPNATISPAVENLTTISDVTLNNNLLFNSNSPVIESSSRDYVGFRKNIKMQPGKDIIFEDNAVLKAEDKNYGGIIGIQNGPVVFNDDIRILGMIESSTNDVIVDDNFRVLGPAQNIGRFYKSTETDLCFGGTTDCRLYSYCDLNDTRISCSHSFGLAGADFNSAGSRAIWNPVTGRLGCVSRGDNFDIIDVNQTVNSYCFSPDG